MELNVVLGSGTTAIGIALPNDGERAQGDRKEVGYSGLWVMPKRHTASQPFRLASSMHWVGWLNVKVDGWIRYELKVNECV